jgi:hypothetical protein
MKVAEEEAVAVVYCYYYYDHQPSLKASRLS